MWLFANSYWNSTNGTRAGPVGNETCGTVESGEDGYVIHTKPFLRPRDHCGTRLPTKRHISCT